LLSIFLTGSVESVGSVFFSGTGFSLGSFDFLLPQLKTPQAKARAILISGRGHHALVDERFKHVQAWLDGGRERVFL
jgi:predicted peptidase